MCLREHVLDLLAGADIPVRHIILLHHGLPFFPLLRYITFGNLTLTDVLHDVECILIRKAPIDKCRHDRVTASDNGVKVADTVVNEVLCVALPYVSSV